MAAYSLKKEIKTFDQKIYEATYGEILQLHKRA